MNSPISFFSYLSTYDLYGPARNAFDGQPNYEGKWEPGRGLAIEIKTFLGPVKWHRAIRRVSFGAAQKSVLCSVVYVVSFVYMNFRAHPFQWPSLP
jgi:hypothetical protein